MKLPRIFIIGFAIIIVLACKKSDDVKDTIFSIENNSNKEYSTITINAIPFNEKEVQLHSLGILVSNSSINLKNSSAKLKGLGDGVYKIELRDSFNKTYSKKFGGFDGAWDFYNEYKISVKNDSIFVISK